MMAGKFRRTSGSTSPLIVAVDQGTSATKIAVVDFRGEVIADASVAVRRQVLRPGWVEQDADEIWNSVHTALHAGMTGLDPTRVVCVGLSTQRESTLLWNRRSGRPLGPVLGWQDVRATPTITRLRQEGHGERVHHVTGLPLDAMFSAAKATALLDLHDPARARARAGELCLGTIDSWLLWKLGAGHLIEVGNASRTQLLDLTTGRWDSRLLGLFDIPAAVLPTPVPSTGPFPVRTPLGPLRPGTPVTAVLGDSHAALFAQAGWLPGRVKVTYGTGSSIMATTGEGTDIAIVRPAVGIARTIAWQSGPDHDPRLNATGFALEGNVRSTGATLVWLAGLLGSTPQALAESAAPDAGGVTLVPAFTGLGAPWWDDQARALICGLSDATTGKHLARAALEATAFQIESVVTAMERTTDRLDLLLADGAATSNRQLMQAQADLSGRTIARSTRASSALGAAHLAGFTAGLWTLKDLEELPRRPELIEPRISQDLREQAQARWMSALESSRHLSVDVTSSVFAPAATSSHGTTPSSQPHSATETTTTVRSANDSPQDEVNTTSAAVASACPQIGARNR